MEGKRLTAAWAGLGAVGMILWVAGCDDPFKNLECSPARNILCPGGKTCVENKCRAVCNSSSECASASEACVSNACVPYAQPCSASTDCAEGWTCNLAEGDCEKLSPLGAACSAAD